MRALALVLALAGCVGTPFTDRSSGTASSPPATSGPVVPIRMDTRGIEAVGTGQRIDFGRNLPGVRDTMTRLQGGAPQTRACMDPAVVALAWEDGLTLVFRNAAFTGWSLRDTTMSVDGRQAFGESCVPVT